MMTVAVSTVDSWIDSGIAKLQSFTCFKENIRIATLVLKWITRRRDQGNLHSEDIRRNRSPDSRNHIRRDDDGDDVRRSGRLQPNPEGPVVLGAAKTTPTKTARQQTIICYDSNQVIKSKLSLVQRY